MSQSVCTNCGTPTQPNANFCPRCGLQYGVQVPSQGAPPHYAPVPPPAPYPPAMPRSGKEKVPAGLLGILLGAFGAHLFYLNHTGWAIFFLLFTIFTCGYGGLITGTIGLIQGIMYLCASDYDFEQKYVIEHRFF